LRGRMWKQEGLFAEGKTHHGLRRARYRGRWKVQAQVYVISTVQNLKRLAATLGGEFKNFIVDWIKKQFSENSNATFKVIHIKTVEISI
ncbi:MAG: transposase, partial [bacterium]